MGMSVIFSVDTESKLKSKLNFTERCVGMFIAGAQSSMENSVWGIFSFDPQSLVQGIA